MVRVKGLEPPRLSALRPKRSAAAITPYPHIFGAPKRTRTFTSKRTQDPRSCAAANFAIGAHLNWSTERESNTPRVGLQSTALPIGFRCMVGDKGLKPILPKERRLKLRAAVNFANPPQNQRANPISEIGPSFSKVAEVYPRSRNGEPTRDNRQ